MLGVVAVAGGAEISLRHGVIIHGRDIVKALAMRIEVATRQTRCCRQVDVLVAVHVPELLARGVWIVRMREGYHQASGLSLSKRT